jgi:hypothetical protein
METLIITSTGDVYKLPSQIDDIPDYSVFRELSTPAYADDFVGPPRPLLRGELCYLLGLKIVKSPRASVPKKPKAVPLSSCKGPKKHWRRW